MFMIEKDFKGLQRKVGIFWYQKGNIVKRVIKTEIYLSTNCILVNDVDAKLSNGTTS